MAEQRINGWTLVEAKKQLDMWKAAAEEIAKQIILRNLSGKIIIDFAGVTDYKFLKNIINMLERGLCEDNTKTNVLGLSRAGNVEIIRQRRRPSLSDVLTKECECCQGTGRVEK